MKHLCDQLGLPSCHTGHDRVSTNIEWYRDSQLVLECTKSRTEAEVSVLLPGHCPMSHTALNQTRQTYQPAECLLGNF